MTACTGLVPVLAPAGGGRLCATCRRPVATYRGRDAHRRGRIAGVSPRRRVDSIREHNRREGHKVAARLAAVDFDGDTCECGAPADPKLHPPVKRHPIEAPGWPSRNTKFPAGSSAGLGERNAGLVAAYRRRETNRQAAATTETQAPRLTRAAHHNRPREVLP